jgi:S-adenosylmethionine/arginine decarboxylase-like enzyme
MTSLPRFDLWGHHLSLDCALGDKSKITDRDHIESWCAELVQKIDMKPFGDPIIYRFGTDNKAGYTLVQLIETSNICAHFCDSTGHAFIDVFSCKDFDSEKVKEVCLEYFGFKTYALSRFQRGTYDGLEDHFPEPRIPEGGPSG